MPHYDSSSAYSRQDASGVILPRKPHGHAAARGDGRVLETWLDADGPFLFPRLDAGHFAEGPDTARRVYETIAVTAAAAMAFDTRRRWRCRCRF